MKIRSRRSSGLTGARAAVLLLGAGLVAAACGSGAPSAGRGTTTTTKSGGTTTTSMPAGSTGSGATGTTGSGTGTSTTPATTPPAPPAGGSVPTGFQPASVTFVSQETGFVLGASSCDGECLALVRTENAGASWVGLAAPQANFVPSTQSGSASGPAVSEVRFADVLDGWAFGPSLFATHDGGRTWTAIDLGGPVVALATSDGVVDAVVSPCKAGQNCHGSYRLVQAPAGGGYWRTVLTGPAEQGGTAVTNDLSLQQGTGFVLLGDGYDAPTAVYATGDIPDPGSWKAFPNPCAATGLSLASFVAPDTRSLYSLCSGDPGAGNTSKAVTLTIDGHTQATGSPPRAGDGGTITATPAGVVVIASSSGLSALYRSSDGGAKWGTALGEGGGAGLYDLGFTTASQGIVVYGLPQPGETSSLLMTRDAGQTWQPVTFG